MSTTDRILELLDNALQSSPEGDVDHDSLGQYLAEDQCWRCMRNPTPEGTTCAGCLAYMEGTSDEDPRSNPFAKASTLRSLRYHPTAIAEMRTLAGQAPPIFSGPNLEVSADRIVYGGHVITDPEILREAITVRHEADGWMWVRWDLGRALELATASLRDSMFVVIERWRIAADTIFPPVPLRRREIRYEPPRLRFRYSADPEEHPERLDPLVQAVLGRGPVGDPVLPSDDWSGWMGTVPPWVSPTATELLAGEIRDACVRTLGPPPELPIGVLPLQCPRHDAELYGGLCRRCHR